MRIFDLICLVVRKLLNKLEGPLSEAEVDAKIADEAGKNPEKLDWQTSVVDLMKALKLDSSLANRKDLADQLGYTGKLDGSAEMNTWLAREVRRQLAHHNIDSLK